MVLLVVILVSGTVAESISSFYDPSDSSSGSNMTRFNGSSLNNLNEDLNNLNKAAESSLNINKDLNNIGATSSLDLNKTIVTSKDVPIPPAYSVQTNIPSTEASVQSKEESCSCANQSEMMPKNAIAMKVCNFVSFYLPD